jgi:hypothetical protein
VGKQPRKTAASAVRAGMDPNRAFVFLSLEEAAAFLKRELRSGDVVLVKGRVVDKLSRLPLSLVQDVTCWRTTCTLQEQCDFCPELTRPVRTG